MDKCKKLFIINVQFLDRFKGTTNPSNLSSYKSYIGKSQEAQVARITTLHTSVPLCVNPCMGTSAIIRAHSLNLRAGMELG